MHIVLVAAIRELEDRDGGRGGNVDEGGGGYVKQGGGELHVKEGGGMVDMGLGIYVKEGEGTSRKRSR